MKLAAVALGVTLAWASASAAEDRSPAEAAVEALSQVCQPALEQEVAPKISAEKIGMTRDAAPPPALVRQFPITQLGSASYSEPVKGGRLYVVGTILPPPVSPYSCAIWLDVDAPELVAQIRDKWQGEKSRYAVLAPAPDPEGKLEQITLNAVDPETGAVDKIMAIRRIQAEPGNPMRVLVLTYRVSAAGMRAAGAK
jgi:hypothetical protein